ncbi:hypothetical protein J4480_03825 [Candidatus Woesearchaeota archaeon]|nr:hypothetical protein [Candidatus Woesearchaeota archaeon]
MRKIIFILMLVIGFVVSGGFVSGQGCGPTPLVASACFGIGAVACGYGKCEAEYIALDATASGVCNTAVGVCDAELNSCMDACVEGCEALCLPPWETCLEAAWVAYTASIQASITTANALQTNIISIGDYASLPCTEMNHCYLKIGSNLASPQTLSCGGISKEAYINVIKNFGKTNALDLGTNIPISMLADSEIWAAGAQYGLEVPFWRQVLVNAYWLAELTSHPFVRVAQALYSAVSTVMGFFKGESGAADPDGVAYSQGNANLAQNAITTALNTQATGTTRMAICPEDSKRFGASAGKPNCVIDLKNGATQCISCLPGEGVVEVRYASIHVIDKKLNNMYTMTGSENMGVVYQNDGFVNIDKGGTTKLSVAGEGAFITDANSNQLYLGAGTTTYFGIGNDDRDTYLTNSVIYDFKSKVGVEGVNEIEQKRLEKPQAGSQKQAFELAVTFNKKDLKPYKNSIDIGKIQEHYRILARGFSNIILLENSNIFPFVTRNYAKGDALVVEHKNARISNAYSVNDEAYEYTIKPIGDSTKVMAKNGKVIQDSGPFSYKLSKRQSLLVYNV